MTSVGKLFLFTLFFFVLAVVIIFIKQQTLLKQPTDIPTGFWKFQSIDTMKVSRDQAGDQSVISKIPNIVKAVADLKATYIAVGTPYDEEFYSVLSTWVREARKNNLQIWFRGNFSGWEGWFNHQKFSTIEAHHKAIANFITIHPELFRDGDIFSPAPEPENGIIGDPRTSEEKRKAYNRFLIDSYANCRQNFYKIQINVSCGYFSMNGDIAKYALDKETVEKTGNVVVIDHYVDNPETMSVDIDFLYKKFGTQIVLGEFGAPIPGINGQMDEDQQARFIESLMKVFYIQKDEILGINYWVISGGSTSVINDNGNLRPAANVLKRYYDPNLWKGRIVNTLGDSITDSDIKLENSLSRLTVTNNGDYIISTPENTITMAVRNENYVDKSHTVTFDSKKTITESIVLEPKKPDIIYRIRLFLKNLMHL